MEFSLKKGERREKEGKRKGKEGKGMADVYVTFVSFCGKYPTVVKFIPNFTL
jgi:hypothetical protein